MSTWHEANRRRSYMYDARFPTNKDEKSGFDVFSADAAKAFCSLIKDLALRKLKEVAPQSAGFYSNSAMRTHITITITIAGKTNANN